MEDHRLSNVLNIEVPSVLYERIPTGIEWIDSALTEEGGLVPSLVYMLSGVPGAGKSTLMRQLADALTGSGHVVVYNSCEESNEQIAISVKKMGLRHGFLVSNEQDHVKLVAMLDRLHAADLSKKLVLVQDSIQKLTARGSVTAANEAIRSWAKRSLQAAIVISQVTKRGEFRGGNEILHDVDVQLELRVSKKTGDRCLIISKNRFGPVSDEDGIPYVITSHGLECIAPVDAGPTMAHDLPKDLKKVTPQGTSVKTNKRAPRRHRNKRGTVVKHGRTRLTVELAGGEVVYLPKACFDVAA